MDVVLDAIEVRVLGSLIEKELATPDYYPLSLNALVNACNQKTNRSPVLALDADTVSATLRALKEKRIVYQSDASRVPKYWQGFAKQCNLVDREAALLGLLLLRGPQTAGELRSRADNLCACDSLEQATQALDNLISTGLVVQLARQPGQKEQRYAHLLAGDPDMGEQVVAPMETVVRVSGEQAERLAALEQEVILLREEIKNVQNELLLFKQSFE